MSLATIFSRTRRFTAAAVVLLTAVASTAFAQITYTWNQTGTASFATATNWTPARAVLATNDVLVFNNGATTTATNVPTQTIGQLSVSGGTTVNLQPAAAATLSIGGGTGTDLSVASGSALNTNTNNALTISVLTGATGSISGNMTFTGATANTGHQLLAADASGITFNSGAVFTQGLFNNGNVFGSGTSNSVVFASGSTFDQLAGSNPFQKAQPASVVVFQTGSLFKFDFPTASTPSFSGRTYANFEYNSPAASSPNGGAALSIDNLKIDQGTFNLGMTGTFNLKGNVTVALGATLNFVPNPATNSTITLNGSSAQTITNNGTFTSNERETFNVNNASGINLGSDITIGNNTVTAGAVSGLTFTSGRVNTGAFTLTLGQTTAAATGAASGTGWVNGKLKRTLTVSAFVANGTWDVGDASIYAPIDFGTTTGATTLTFTGSTTPGEHGSVATSGLDASKDVNRYYTFSTNSGSFSNANLTFHFAASDVDGPANFNNFVVKKFDGPSTWTSTTTGTKTSTSTQATGVSGFSDFAIGELAVHTITASSGPNGAITPSGAVSVTDGNNQTFNFMANPCYHVADVLVDNVSVGAPSSYTFTNVTADHTISVSFAVDVETITATAGAGGSISPSGAVPVNCGSDQTFTISPADKCHTIADVKVDGVSQGPIATYTFTNVQGNHTIDATFNTLGPFTINATSSPGGTISPSGAVSVVCGANQTFLIAPADKCHAIFDVKVDGVSVGTPSSYTFSDVQANHTIDASFTQLGPFNIVATASPGGSISPSGTIGVPCGGNATFSISPSDKCHFIADVKVDGVSVGAVSSYTFSDVQQAHTIDASFGTFGPFTITATAGAGGTISPSGAVSVACGGGQTFTITPNGGFAISDVKVDNVSVGAVASYTFSDVQANHTIDASFAAAGGPVHDINTGLNYATINAAISDPSTLSGHTLVCDPGNYPENVVLNKSLVIKGNQAGVAACGRVSGPPNPATESIINGPGPRLWQLVTGSAGSVIDGFSFVGGSRQIESTSGPLDNLKIQNNHFTKFTGNAIFLNDNGVDVTVNQNNVDANAQTGGDGSIHLDTDSFTGFWLTKNCIGGDPNAPNGSGFFVDGNHNVAPSANRNPLIDSNIMEKHATNVGANLGSRSFTGGAISNNTIRNNQFDGIQGGIQKSAIRFNQFLNNKRWGLALTSFGNLGADRGGQLDSIYNNTFTNNDSAGYFISATQVAGNASGCHANHNDIVGNAAGSTKLGVIYRGTETIDVGCNWWGDINGPNYPPSNPNPPGDGIFASSATFSPWLNGPIATNPACDQFVKHTITATAGPGGSINPSGAVIVPDGGSQTFTITPADKCQSIDKVFVDGNNVGAVSTYTFNNVTSDHTINATFVTRGPFTITASVVGCGTISPSGAVSVPCGGSQTFNFSPCDKCHVVSIVKVDGQVIGAANRGGNSPSPVQVMASYTFSDVQANHTIEVTFSELGPYVISASAGPGGSVSPAGDTEVPCGGSQTYTITPADKCHVIADVKVDNVSVGPVATYTFSDVQTDHTISATFSQLGPFTITATAGAGGSISPSGAVSVSCGASQTFNITPNACYHIADVKVDGNSVGPVASYTFSDVQANHTIDATFAPDVSISISDAIGPEGNSGTTPFVFKVSLSGPCTEKISVDYSTADGSATLANHDYVATNGTLSFAAGEVSQLITVPVNGDLTQESDEHFFVNLSNPVNAAIGDGQGDGTIVNDDTAPTISISDVSANEGNSGLTVFKFFVSLSNMSSTPITVDYKTVDGTATIANNDYQAKTGTLTIAPKTPGDTIRINVVGDTKFETDENFSVVLSNAVGGTILDDTGVGTIVNDDVTPKVSIGNVSKNEGDSGLTPFVFTISLNNQSINPVSVDWHTTDGTGGAPATLANNDYVAASGTATIAPKTSSTTITVNVVGDVTFEQWENFKVVLTNPVNATLGTATGTGTIQNDDPIPTISIDKNVSVTEGNSGQTTVSLKVTLSHGSSDDVLVDYNTADGSATAANNDYMATSGTLDFGPKSLSQTIDVVINGDIADEPNETFTVHLSRPRGGQIESGDAVITIVNDDQGPQVTVISPNGGETLVVGQNAKLQWSATDNKSGPLTIDLFMSNNNGATYGPIASGIPNTGSYVWHVDAAFATNTGDPHVYSALFKVVAKDADGKVGQDVSDAPFDIYNQATPTLLSLFRAASLPSGIELRWRFGDAGLVSAVRVERAEQSAGPWSVVDAAAQTSGGESTVLDGTAAVGRSYWYRLNATLVSGQSTLYGPISAKAGEAISAFALGHIGPTPSAGLPVQIEYTVAKAAYGRISVVDLQGRLVTTLVEGTLNPGRYQAVWNAKSDVPTGVYFVRYQVAGTQFSRRIVVTE